VDAETLIGRVPDRVWSFSIHRRPVTQSDGEEELASRVQRWEVAVPVVRELRPGGWLSDVMYVDFLVALEHWCHGEASVAERENAVAFVWRRFNSVFHPSGRDDEEEWRGLQWQEPLVGESEHDTSKWLEATSTDGHTSVVFRFLHAEVRVRYAGPAHFDVAAARRAAGRAREIEEERARDLHSPSHGLVGLIGTVVGRACRGLGHGPIRAVRQGFHGGEACGGAEAEARGDRQVRGPERPRRVAPCRTGKPAIMAPWLKTGNKNRPKPQQGGADQRQTSACFGPSTTPNNPQQPEISL
jgi:hypothetical protein